MTDRRFLVYRWVGPTGSYIGKGTVKRAKHHMPSAIGGSRNCPKFYSAIRKYGRASFRLEFLKTGLTEAESFRDEILCIYLYEPEYNLTAGGEGVSGYVVTEERKQRLRDYLLTPGVKARQSETTKKQWEDPEKRAKFLAARTAYLNKPGTKEAMSKARQGVRLSDKAKKGISDRMKRSWADPEFKAKRKAAMSFTKREISQESRARRSSAAKARFADPEERVKVSAGAKAQWSNPETRAKMLAAMKRSREARVKKT